MWRQFGGTRPPPPFRPLRPVRVMMTTSDCGGLGQITRRRRITLPGYYFKMRARKEIAKNKTFLRIGEPHPPHPATAAACPRLSPHLTSVFSCQPALLLALSPPAQDPLDSFSCKRAFASCQSCGCRHLPGCQHPPPTPPSPFNSFPPTPAPSSPPSHLFNLSVLSSIY